MHKLSTGPLAKGVCLANARNSRPIDKDIDSFATEVA